jgi:hypothetical protein
VAPASPPDNNFNYAKDPMGQGCPLNAHVRVMNDRTKADRAHVIARRGQAYGTANWRDADAGSVDNTETGLLFMAMNADIANQFEFLQRRADNKLPIAHSSVAPGNGDVLIGRGVAPSGISSSVRGGSSSAVPQRPLVTVRGGEYFFLPSLAFLKQV